MAVAVLVLLVAVTFLVCRNKGTADNVAEVSLRLAGVVLGQEPVVQPYGEIHVGRITGRVVGVRWGGAGAGGDGGAPQPTFANPAYAHHHAHDSPNIVAGDADYAEVADCSDDDEEDEAPYEEPIQEQVAIYDGGGALGAERQCIQTTASGRCPKFAAACGERCSMHVCSKEGCAEAKSSKVKFCRTHAKAKARQPSKYLGFGADDGGDDADEDPSSNA